MSGFGGRGCVVTVKDSSGRPGAVFSNELRRYFIATAEKQTSS